MHCNQFKCALYFLTYLEQIKIIYSGKISAIQSNKIYCVFSEIEIEAHFEIGTWIKSVFVIPSVVFYWLAFNLILNSAAGTKYKIIKRRYADREYNTKRLISSINM